jgi:2-oxoglutarate ferredoxin oxidoreductase subunit gamma
MLIKTVFSGFGGQGVLSMGQTLAKAAMLEDKFVTYLPSYGAEVRGGTANCTVTISDEEIASPIASEPEFVVALNQPSFFRFQNLLPTGGFMLYNTSLVSATNARGDIEVLGVPTTDIATKLGSVKVTNMVMMGAFIGVSNLLPFERMLKNLPEVLGGGKAHLLKTNQEAFQAGYDFVKKEQKKC